MRVFFSVSAFMAIFATACLLSEKASAKATCLTANDEYLGGLLAYVRKTATSTETGATRIRARIGLPLLEVSAVEPDGAPSSCAGAQVLINRDQKSPDTLSRKLYVVLAGHSHHFVMDTSVRAGEWRTVFVMDSGFTKIVGRLDF